MILPEHSIPITVMTDRRGSFDIALAPTSHESIAEPASVAICNQRNSIKKLVENDVFGFCPFLHVRDGFGGGCTIINQNGSPRPDISMSPDVHCGMERLVREHWREFKELLIEKT